MTDLPSDFRLAASALFTGMDILARAQYLAGFAGLPANAALRLTSKGAQLKFLEQTAKELSPSVSPTWWSDAETGFYRPVYKSVMSRLSGDVSTDDILAEAMSDDTKPPFWRAGLKAQSGPLAEKILSGEIEPKKAVGLPINFVLDEAVDYIRVISNRRRLEREQSALIEETVHPGAVGGFDQTEWEMVIDGIFNNANDPISKGFFAWLRSKVQGADTGAARVMLQYIDMAMTGQYKNEAEIARALGMPNQAYLNRVVKEFTPMIAGWLAKGKGDVGPIRDLLSDRSFLMKLLKGKGDVPFKYAKLLRKASLMEAAKRASQQSRLLSAHDYAGMLTTAKFPAGKSMTVDEVSEVVGPEFKEMNENPPESVKKVMDEMKKSAARVLLSTDAFAEMLRDSKFEKGKPADPTKNMSAEDAAEWERQNEEHADQFKTAKLPSKAIPAGTRVSVKANPASRMLYSTDLPVDGTEGETVAILTPFGKSTFMPGPGGGMIYVQFDNGTFLGVSPRDLIRSSGNLGGVDKTAAAAGGLYGFTKSAEKSCTGAAGKLAKYATKLAKELYTADADTAPFLEEHAKRGFKTARMLRNAMEDIGPGPAPKTAASKSGLYGFKDRTAKLAMNACSNLHQAAGHLAADLAAKFGEKQEDGAAFLKKHAKAAKCAHSDLILDSYPSAPVKVAEKPPVASKAPAGKKAFVDPTVDEILAWDRAVANRMATSFLAAEDDRDTLAEDLTSEWDADVMAGRTWGGPNYRPKPVDDSIPYNSHPESPPAGANGSAERRRYNKWFRENVCPDHATNCGL